MPKRVKPPVQPSSKGRKYETNPCPECGDSKKPGLNPLDYTKTCENCKGRGKIRTAVKA